MNEDFILSNRIVMDKLVAETKITFGSLGHSPVMGVSAELAFADAMISDMAGITPSVALSAFGCDSHDSDPLT